jgi:Mn2+/Fe2+ NRAMP family transporter
MNILPTFWLVAVANVDPKPIQKTRQYTNKYQFIIFLFQIILNLILGMFFRLPFHPTL